MKALLINPYYVIPRAWVPHLPYEPLALEYLATMVEGEHQVRILDCVGEFPCQYQALPDGRVRVGAYPDQIKDVISMWHPDLVGISMQFVTQMRQACHIAQLIKDSDKNIVTVIGGTHASVEPERILSENPSVDMVVVGEGELTFKELLDRKATDLDKINGIVYKNGNNIIRNEFRKPIDDLDEIPFPRRDLVPFANYSSSLLVGSPRERLNTLITWLRFNRDWERLRIRLRHIMLSRKLALFRGYSSVKRASILTSRGCPFNCHFCSPTSVYGQLYRMRSPSNVLEEIEMLVKDYGVEAISIVDDNFNVSKKWVVEICEEVIRRGLHLTLIAVSGMCLAPWLDFETLTLMKKAGFNEIYFGIENANQEILDKVINKKIDVKKVPEVTRLCKKAGIIPGGYLILGVPGETIETMENTVEFAFSSGLEKIRIWAFQPGTGTKLYEDCVNNGWLVEGYEPSDEAMLASRSYVKTPDFSPEDVNRLLESAKKRLRKANKLDMT